MPASRTAHRQGRLPLFLFLSSLLLTFWLPVLPGLANAQSTTRYTYDAKNGNLTSRTDANGNKANCNYYSQD